MEVWVCGWASRSFLALLILYQRQFDKFSIKKTSCILFKKDNMLFHSLYTIISQNHEEYHENAAIQRESGGKHRKVLTLLAKCFHEELDARALCFHVLHEQQVIKSLPIKGLVGILLTFEQFLAHMGRQARTLQRLRSLQERNWRTAALASP